MVKALFPYLVEGKAKEALARSESLIFAFPFHFLIVGLIAIGLIFLRLLPILLREDRVDNSVDSGRK